MEVQQSEDIPIISRKRSLVYKKNPSQPNNFNAPQLIQPDFSIPTISRLEEHETSSIEFSGRVAVFSSERDNLKNKTQQMKDVSSLDDSQNILGPTQEFQETKKDDKSPQSFWKIGEQTSITNKPSNNKITLGGLSSNHIQSSQNLGNSVFGLNLVSNILQQNGGSRYSNNLLKKQSKYINGGVDDTDKNRKVLMQSIYQPNTMDQTELQVKEHSSQFYGGLSGQMNKFQKKVCSIGMVFLFSLRLHLLSGVRTQFKEKQQKYNQFTNHSSSNKKIQSIQNVTENQNKLNQIAAYKMKLLNNLSINPEKNILSQEKDFDQANFKIIGSAIQYVSKFLVKIPIIHPNSRKLFLWDIINFFFIILNLVYVPIESVIDKSFSDMYGKKWNIFLSISIGAYFFSMLLSTNLGFYDKGYCIMDRQQILARYFKLGFWLDLMSTIPMFMSVINVNGLVKVFNLLVVLKIQWIDRFFNKYFEIFQLKKMTFCNVFAKFFYILLKIFFLAHCFACIFLAMGFHLSVDQSWITKYGNGLPERGWFYKYVYAVYWGVTTMTTVGLGDLLPANIYEVLALSLFMFISCGTFAYSFNAIGDILGDINQKHEQFSKEMRIVNRYLSMKSVERDLQLEVRKYIEYKFDFENDVSLEEEEQVFKKLSPQIKEKLIISTNILILKNCTFLSANFSESFLTSLCLEMKSESFFNQEIIFNQGDTQKNNSLDCIKFYILESGQIQLFIKTDRPDKQIFIKNLNKGDNFGAIEFFSDQPRNYTTKSLGSTKALSIQRSQFITLLKQYPLDYEKFCMLRDYAKNNKKQNKLKINCYCCESNSHEIADCQMLHYVSDKELAILKNSFSQDQKRGLSVRSQRLKINSRFEQFIIQSRAKDFCKETNMDINEESNSPASLALQPVVHLTRNPSKYLQYLPEIDSPEYVVQQYMQKRNHLAQGQPLLKTAVKGSVALLGQTVLEKNRDNSVLQSPQKMENNNNSLMLRSNRRKLTHLGSKFFEVSMSKEQHYLKIDKKTEDNTADMLKFEKTCFDRDNFEKSKRFNVYCEHNNYDKVLLEYDKLLRENRLSNITKRTQYSLFPRFQVKVNHHNSWKNLELNKINHSFRISEFNK